MGGYASKPPQIDLSAYTGQPYPFAMMRLYEQGIRVYLVALKKDEEYQPSADLDTKDAVIILYDADTANVLKCLQL